MEERKGISPWQRALIDWSCNANWKNQIWFGTCILKWEENLPFAKRPSPKICSVCLGNAECFSLKLSTWKDGFDLGQHVTEDQRELGEVPSAREQDEQRQKHMVSTLNRQEISSQCKCTHVERKVNSQHSLLGEFLVLELVWKLMCRTRLPSNSMRIQCNLMHAFWRARWSHTRKQTLTGLRPTEQRRSAPVAVEHCKKMVIGCLQLLLLLLLLLIIIII